MHHHHSYHHCAYHNHHCSNLHLHPRELGQTSPRFKNFPNHLHHIRPPPPPSTATTTPFTKGFFKNGLTGGWWIFEVSLHSWQRGANPPHFMKIRLYSLPPSFFKSCPTPLPHFPVTSNPHPHCFFCCPVSLAETYFQQCLVYSRIIHFYKSYIFWLDEVLRL